MSEFTDYMALQTQAETIPVLETQLKSSIGTAFVDYLPVDDIFDADRAVAQYSALDKPLWVVVQSPGPLAKLAEAGPAVHLSVEEDFSTWSLRAQCGGKVYGALMVRPGQNYFEATEPHADLDKVSDGETWPHSAELAQCLGADPAQLAAALVPDGGQAFASTLGFHYEQMLDQSLEEYSENTILFPWSLD